MAEDWKYQISLALPDSTPDSVLVEIYDAVESAIATERERVWGEAERILTESGFGDLITKGILMKRFWEAQGRSMPELPDVVL